MQFNIIVNSLRIKPKQIKIIEDVFKSAGHDCKFYMTDHKGHAGEIAEKLSSSGNECSIVAMGGDGTLHEVLNGIKDFENCSLGLIPSGTGNDFAVAAHIPKDIRQASQIIAFKEPKRIDYIELSGGLKSINAVGMGIDVDVLKHVYTRGKKSNYFTALVHCLRHFKSYNFTVTYDGKQEQHYGLIAALGNGTQIGGGIKLFPDAELDDGYMNILMVDYLSRLRTISAFIKLITGKINTLKEVTAARVKSASFTTEKPCSIQAEGELYDDMKLDAHIVEGGLKFYLP